MSTEKLPSYAASRENLFLKHMKKARNEKRYLTGFELLRIIEHLLTLKVSPTEAIVYLEMVWIAGTDLDREVTAVRVGEALGKLEAAVRRTIRNLEKKGLVKKYAMNHYRFVNIPGISKSV